MAAESGLRSHVMMALRYRHLMEDLENGTVPVAVRLEPRFYVGKKAAGYTFLGVGSVNLLRECVEERLVEAKPDARLFQRSYYGVWAAIHRAKRKARLDPKIQPCHGFRKYFENAPDEANIDHEKKMVIEGHFAGTRARHYTERDIEQLRELYKTSCPFVDIALLNHREVGVGPTDLQKRLVQVENQLARQSVLEARLDALQNRFNSEIRMNPSKVG